MIAQDRLASVLISMNYKTSEENVQGSFAVASLLSSTYARKMQNWTPNTLAP